MQTGTPPWLVDSVSSSPKLWSPAWAGYQRLTKTQRDPEVFSIADSESESCPATENAAIQADLWDALFHRDPWGKMPAGPATSAEVLAASTPIPSGERRPVGRPPGLRALGAGPNPVTPNLSAQPLASQNIDEPPDAAMEATNAGSTKRLVEDVGDATRGAAAGPRMPPNANGTGDGGADTLLERMAELASDKSAAKTLAGIMPRMEAVEAAQRTCASDIDTLKQGQAEIIKQLQDMKTRAASSASTTASGGMGTDAWRNQQQGSDYQPSTIEIKGFANFDNVNTAGIEFATLIQWIERFASLAPRELVDRFDIEHSKGEQYQGGWPRYLAVKLRLRDPMRQFHARELCRELKEVFLTDAGQDGAMQLNNITLNAYAEISPERKPIKIALGRAMAGLRSFGIDTHKNVRATFPRSGPYITTLWDMSAHPPDIIGNLHPAGWEIMPTQMRKLCDAEPEAILAAMR